MSTVIDGSAGITTNAGGSVNPSTNVDGINYSCRAWVRFNAAGTILASGNVSSVTKNGTGDYTITFTNAISDANYSVGLSTQSNGGVYDGICIKDGVAPTTTTLRVFNCNASTGAGRDPTLACVQIFR